MDQSSSGPSSTEAPRFPVVRSGISLWAPFSWLSQGLSDLHPSPGPSLFYGFCISALGWLLFVAFRSAIELAAAAVTGFILLGPFLGMGLYELSRRRERNLPCTLWPTLAIWRRNAAAIGIYSMILIVLYLLWARASMVAFALFYTGGLLAMDEFVREIGKAENIEFLVLYVVVGGLFAILAFAASVVSLPLMLDRGQDAITAMLASIVALSRNAPALLVWAALIAIMVFVGIGLAWVGLIVTMPIVGHATWHAYRDLVADAE